MESLAITIALLCLAACAVAQPETPAPIDELQQITIRTEDITAVIGNHADHGSGRVGYNGIHELTHEIEAENLFVPLYAGIITARSRASVWKTSDTEAMLAHFSGDKPWQWIRYTARPPHYLDLEISSISNGKGFYINSASYMNGPTDRHIYFVDIEGDWQKHFDAVHGDAASVYPHGATLPTLTKVPDAVYKHGTNSFADSVSEWRFDPSRCLYYGRFKNMVYIQMFEPNCGLRFYMSPTGGGGHPEGRPNPAWDWGGNWLVDGKPGELATGRVRVVYKEYISDADCLQEYEKWLSELE